jgi:hypothetical protein
MAGRSKGHQSCPELSHAARAWEQQWLRRMGHDDTERDHDTFCPLCRAAAAAFDVTEPPADAPEDEEAWAVATPAPSHAPRSPWSRTLLLIAVAAALAAIVAAAR